MFSHPFVVSAGFDGVPRTMIAQRLIILLSLEIYKSKSGHSSRHFQSGIFQRYCKNSILFVKDYMTKISRKKKKNAKHVLCVFCKCASVSSGYSGSLGRRKIRCTVLQFDRRYPSRISIYITAALQPCGNEISRTPSSRFIPPFRAELIYPFSCTHADLPARTQCLVFLTLCRFYSIVFLRNDADNKITNMRIAHQSASYSS